MNVASGRMLKTFAPVLAGLVILYVPVYFDLYRIFWRTSRDEQGIVILALVAWLVWRRRAELFSSPDAEDAPAWALAAIALGLILFLVSRPQEFYHLEVLSQVPLLLGIVGLLLGAGGVRSFWFPIALLVFVVPMPDSLQDQLLLPLKAWVSQVVDTLLHAAGYPIARSGVVLTIGPYNLLIADACSGLNSMMALTGIGLIYVHLAGHVSRWLNAVLVASIIPIAFAANVVRVILLVLVTYYFGDSAGRSLHDIAALLEIAVVFGCFFALSGILTRFQRPQGNAGPLSGSRGAVS